MSISAMVLYLSLMLALISLFKQLQNLAGLPNVLSLVKDIAILTVFGLVLRRSRFLYDPKMISIALLFIGFLSYYLFISAFEGQLLVGLYYLRIYLLPVLFFVACKFVLSTLSREDIDRLVKYWVVTNYLIIIAAGALYYLLLVMPAAKLFLFGADELHFSWYISGANMLRMGLPLGGPNGQGVYLAVSIYFIVTAMSLGRTGSISKKTLYLLLVLNLIALILTFSRSSALLLVTSLGLYLVVVDNVNRQVKMTIVKYLILALTVGAASLLVVNEVTDSLLSRWLYLNLSMTDPSMIGHWDSIRDALETLEKYYLYGYERGTVGPKAVLFSNVMMNVENSTLILLYDLGIFGFFLFLVAYALLIQTGYRSRVQLPLMVGMLINFQFLPNIMSGELVMCILFLYLLIGELARDQVKTVKVDREVPYERGLS